MQNFKAEKWQFWARGRLSCFSPKYVCWSWERYGLFPNLTTLTAPDYLGCNNNKNYLHLYIFFSISSPLNYMLTFSLLAEQQHISEYCCLHVGHVAWCWGICPEQCVVDFTWSQVQRMKAAAASKRQIHKRVEQFESKRGSSECFEGSGFKNFS